ncbi:MAG: InlB B-repeat-containing protein, partial [Muribaculaceae bacterium]|nr:InlB B-repeat-containing protein [Muribaculaceae bacterium]
YNTAVPRFTPDPQEGKTFSGWGVIPDLMPARDLEFNGSMISNVYTLTFRIGGLIVSSDRMAYGAEIIAPEAPAREGYSFTGWQDVPAAMPAKDLLIEGDYEINKYKVTYMLEGVEYLTQEYEYGAPIVAPADPVEEGSTFSGWGDVPATMPAHDLVFGGTFADNFYRVTFRLDGTVIYTDDFIFGTPISAPEAPEKEGHTFNGWGEVPATMPAYNLEFDGSYTVNTYAVTFKIGDEVIYTGSLAYGADITAPEAPAKEGYSFGGWGIVPVTMPASDLEIPGDYTVNSYTLTYRIGEEDFFTTQLPYGSEITAPEVPAKEGHTFAGWSSIPSTMPANDLVITGAYSVNSYVLSFKIGDETIFSGEIPYGMEISAPEAPAKDGYSFTGWGMVPSTMPASDLEVLGAYEVNLYNLTYRIDGEDFYTTQIAYGSEIPAFDAPVKEGHSFLGWSDAVSTMPANDVVINGTYSVNSYNVVFKIGEDVIFEGALAYGSEIIAPDAPAKEGHSFTGWGMVPATMPASDLEFSGAYEVNVYTLTFDIDGEVFFTTQLAYGTEITAPSEVPDKEGHGFGGWGDVPSTMPANDLVISGTYSSNNYTLTFKIGEEVIFTGQQPFGSEIVVPEVPEKVGYTFSGWGDVPATVPAENLVFVGEYIVNKYKLQFSVDGEVVASDMIAYGDPIVVPAVTDKEGHSFSGFGVVPATMPASDLELNGTFEKNYYSVTFKAGEDIVYTAQVLYGDKIEAPEAPAKEGEAFEAWGVLPETMPAA